MLQKLLDPLLKKSFNTDSSGLRIQTGAINLHGAKSIKLFRFRIELWPSNHGVILNYSNGTYAKEIISDSLDVFPISAESGNSSMINYLVDNNKN